MSNAKKNEPGTISITTPFGTVYAACNESEQSILLTLQPLDGEARPLAQMSCIEAVTLSGPEEALSYAVKTMGDDNPDAEELAEYENILRILIWENAFNDKPTKEGVFGTKLATSELEKCRHCNAIPEAKLRFGGEDESERLYRVACPQCGMTTPECQTYYDESGLRKAVAIWNNKPKNEACEPETPAATEEPAGELPAADAESSKDLEDGYEADSDEPSEDEAEAEENNDE